MDFPENWGFDTRCQHVAEDYGFADSVTPPIFQTSLFVYPTLESFAQRTDLDDSRYVYTRVGNPTTSIAEQKLASLEHTERCRLTSSGMAAISAAVMHFSKAGSHIVATEASYGPTKYMMREWLPRFGVQTTFVDGRDLNAIKAAITPQTSLIYMESPGTFLFHIQDIRGIVGIAKEHGVNTILDNSCATPYFQQPADFGVDLIVHSATKYLGGHSDIVAGAICGPSEIMQKLIADEGLLLGASLDPFASWLMVRSFRTLGIRMERHQQTAREIALFLSAHPKVQEVFWPGLSTHAGHELACTQMSGASGMLSFRPTFCDEERSVKVFCEGLALFQMGVSWGGHESLCIPLNSPETGGKWLCRISAGLETAADLIADLEQAFERV
jgi:cystathionine beta-lyase/cystathionine gamma-synthase